MRFEPMAFDEFASAVRSAQTTGNRAAPSVSVFTYMPADLLTPVSAFLKLRGHSRFSFLLESVEDGERPGRYSFIGTRPSRIVRAFGTHTFLEKCDESTRRAEPEQGDVFEVLNRELSGTAPVINRELPPFTSGAVGYMGYDTVRLIERVPAAQPDGFEMPDAVWAVFDTVVAFDHARQVIVLMKRVVVEKTTDARCLFEVAMSELREIESRLSDDRIPLPDPPAVDHNGARHSMTREAFMHAVDRAREHIRIGDIFQVVLSQRVDLPFEGDPFGLYRTLRQTNPSPYLFYLQGEGFALIGSSPESLLRLQDGDLSTVPIAGTRPRGNTPEEDEQLERDLLGDPKELAEHLMLVDLGRNDLGRVSLPGTVKVTDFKSVVRYSHVMHLVSLVTGQLAPNCSAIDALKACFPAGTVSGAPKVRAMEIISELEPIARGCYAGAVGYLDFCGNLDVCIAIRMMVACRGRLLMQAGAGIVADSNADREWEETESKLRAMLAATGRATDRFAPA